MWIQQWVPAFAAVLQAISITVTAIFAVRGLRTWRDQLVGKRKFEVAEKARSTFIRAREGLTYIRNPMSLAGEMDEYLRSKGFDPLTVPTPLSQYMAVSKRIFEPERQQQFVNLVEAQDLARIHLPKEVDDALQVAISARHKVWLAGHMLVSTFEANRHRQLSNEEIAQKRQWSETIWEGSKQPDEIKEQLNNAETILVQSCGAFLK